MSIVVRDIAYRLPNRQNLLEHIGFSVPENAKVSITGGNGIGKSTLLKLLAGELTPSRGVVQCASKPYYVPQQIGMTRQRVCQALGVAQKIDALQAIYNGDPDPVHYDRLADDWQVESRCRAALDHWGLAGVDFDYPVDALSGGEKTKVYLAGLLVHDPGIILLDEPTNHLDRTGRQKLYDYITRCKSTVVGVSHDITLLNLLETTYELSGTGLRMYGGNHSFYQTQKAIEDDALSQRIHAGKKALDAACKKAREVGERQEKRVNRGGKTTTGIPRIVLGGRRGQGEKTGSKLSEKHADIIAGNRQRLSDLRQRQRKDADLKIDFENARLHEGKLLFSAVGMNFGYADREVIWRDPLDVEIRSGDRVHIVGDNGSGKTTLIRLLTGELTPSEGAVWRSEFSYVYLDQQYSQIQRDITILELAREYNANNLLDHEIKLRLDRALFPQATWDKNCLTLSGGERMRLYLCTLMLSNHVPDVFILDEPTNNLDISSLSILVDTIRHYHGTVVLISHDDYFVDSVGITNRITLFVRARHPSVPPPDRDVDCN